MPDTIEQRVIQHYAHGTLEQSILAALKASGKDPDHLSLTDLAAVDEFHIGGRRATIDFAAQLDLSPGLHLLDVGCGLGGASRYFIQHQGCRVTGVDLSPEYVQVAESLARRAGLDGAVSYQCASALTLPFPAATFDGAYMLHVGMNIENKRAAFAEIRRVLKPQAVFGIYDVMRETDHELSYPVPWASGPATDFAESAAAYRHLLAAAGFELLKERSRRDFAIQFFHAMRTQTVQANPRSPLGLHILMGITSPQKIKNMIDNLERGWIAPTDIICRAN